MMSGWVMRIRNGDIRLDSALGRSCSLYFTIENNFRGCGSMPNSLMTVSQL